MVKEIQTDQLTANEIDANRRRLLQSDSAAGSYPPDLVQSRLNTSQALTPPANVIVGFWRPETQLIPKKREKIVKFWRD